MTRPKPTRTWNFGIHRCTAVVVLTIAFAVAVGMTPPAQAQTFSVIHTFSGVDGATPAGRLTMDKAGNLYGTTVYGGTSHDGNVFKMSRRSSGWTITPLYSFSGSDGNNPENGVVFGPDGSLYGSTFGTVFNLKPSPTRPPTVFSPWNLTTLYQFQGGSDGESTAGDVIFDSQGDIYGVTFLGGQGCYEGCGTIYELTPSNGAWKKNTLYYFQGLNDGAGPAGVIFDSAGNLCGTTETGGADGAGTIFKFVPSGSGWRDNTLYSFDYRGSGGFYPQAGLITDASGNLYGGTSDGPGSSGTIFELSPSNGVYTVLYQIPSRYEGGPAAPLFMDAAGNLYGTINGYCVDCPGAVFKLTPGSSGWTFTSLHDFTGGSDGSHPLSNVVMDANGNLYGTASEGGTGCNGTGCGVVWEITP
jgi:uncharacterized repeat protein (TIGR03803 family)